MPQPKRKNRQRAILETLGLGENEASLYLLMLKYPKSTVQELQNKTPFPRTMLYYLLNNLIAEGLLTPLKQKWRTVYIAEDPERLYDLLEGKQREFEKQKTDIRSLIPELRQTYRLSGSRPTTRIFEGLDQYKIALEDIFSTGADILYTYVPSLDQKNPALELRREFQEQRQHHGLIQYILVKNKKVAEEFSKIYSKDRLTQIRYVEDKTSVPDIDVRLYTDKVMYTRYDKHEPIVLLIEDQHLYSMQKILFLNLWNNAHSL